MTLKPFVLNQSDLEFILAQLDFIPLFTSAGDAIINWDGTGAVYDAAGHLLFNSAVGGSYAYNGVTLTSANALDILGHSFPTATSFVGLREQTGVHNNLTAGEPTQTWGVSGATFIRMVPADFWNYVSGVNYTPGLTITDATPRMISRTITTGGMVLLEDAAGAIVYWSSERYANEPAYTAVIDSWNTANPTAVIDTLHQIDGAAVVVDRGIVGQLGQIDFQNPDNGEVFVGSINPGVAPTNGWFALFGQFFDHGLDFIDKSSASGKVIIPLSVDDPLYRAPGTLGPQDPGNTKITISRAVIAGTDANGDPTYVNHTSPYIDQNQTYGSTEAVSTLLREWVQDPLTGNWVAGAKLLDGATLADAWTDGWGNVTHATLPTLAELNAHLIATGRDPLTWADVSNLRNRDAAGHVVAGTTGHPLLLDMNPKFDTLHFSDAVESALALVYVKFDAGTNSMVTTTSGDPAGHAILPGVDGTYSLTDLSALIDFRTFSPLTDLAAKVLFDSVSAHYVAGDGRANENFGLTAVHHVFHSEHNYQVENLLQALTKQDANLVAQGDSSHATLHGFQIDTGRQDAAGNFLYADNSIAWDVDKVFLGTKVIVEMEYQHTAVDQFAPTITPDIPEYVGYNSGIDASISLEFGQVAYRFGHSVLRETIDTIDPNGSITGKIVSYALQMAFLNPDKYAEVGPGAITLGMTHQQAGDVDEFLTPALNQGLLGQPLDLAAINIARGRDLGIPTLNEMRVALGVQAYDSWASFAESMGHRESLAAFIAAYSFNGAMDKAQEIVDLADGVLASGTGTMGWTIGQAIAFLNNAASAETPIAGADGVNHIDSWMGGLAEVHVMGGLLGETFNILFVDQIGRLKDGDRMYYLYRLVNQNFGDEIATEQFKDIVERNTGLQHLNGNIFAYADQYYDLQRDGDLTTPGVQNDIADHAYGAALEAHPTAGILSRGGSDASNGVVLSYIAPQLASYSRQNVSIDGRTVSYDTATGTLAQYILDQRPELDPSQVSLEGTPVTGAGSHEVLIGTDRNDILYMEGGDDTAYGEAGDDLLFGGSGIDRLYGGDGNDTLLGGDGGDLMDGGDGDDVLVGGGSGTAAAGLNQLVGGQGDDVIYAGQGIDKISGGGGDDVIYGQGDTDPFTHGGDGNDYIDGGVSGDLLYGDNGDDVLVGGNDQDVLMGGDGDDILRPGNASTALAGLGPDEVIGGDGITDTGFDMIDFSDYTAGAAGVVADMTLQNNPLIAIDKTTPFPAWFQIEGVIGSQAGDTLTGDDTGNWLVGGSGSDRLQGGAGFDVLVGDGVRLDALIGSYSGTFNRVDDITGATHRATGTLQNNGILGRADLGTADFDLHFTDMASSRMFKDYVLGNDGGPAGGTDVAVYGGNMADYRIERVQLNPGDPDVGAVWKVTGINQAVSDGIDVPNGSATADGVDLLIGIEKVIFANGEKSLVNYPPTGVPTINDTTPVAGQTLICNALSINDPNGFSILNARYQWQVQTGGTWTNIAGQTNFTHTVGAGEVGNPLRVVVSFVDGLGTLETVYSAATSAVGNTINGTNGVDTLTGTAGDDQISGLQGNDTINAGAGNDNIIWNANQLGSTDGRDFVDGGAGVDTITVNTRVLGVETYRIYTRAAALLANITINNANTEIVITRGQAPLFGATTYTPILELDNIEEIVIGTNNVTAPTNGVPNAGGAGLGDTVQIFGNFSQTSLLLNTITVNGTDGNDLVDISALESAHRIVFRTAGGNDTVIGTLRAQDVIELPVGAVPADYVPTDNGDGTVTLASAVHSVMFTGTIDALPVLTPAPEPTPVDPTVPVDPTPVTPGEDSTGLGDDGLTGDDAAPVDAAPIDPAPVDPTPTVPVDTAPVDPTPVVTPPVVETPVVPVDTVPVAPVRYFGTALADAAVGGEGADIMLGRGGDDALIGEGGNDVLRGEEGDDFLSGDAGRDMIFGGIGNDDILAGQDADMVYGDDGQDRLFGNEGDDILNGGLGDDTLHGDEGDDLFVASEGDGDDVYDGGIGTDTLDMSAILANITVDLGIGLMGHGASTGTGYDSLNGIENVVTGRGADTIMANAAVNVLDGGEGDNTFVFRSVADARGDTILGFNAGDVIDLSGIDANTLTGGLQTFTLVGRGMEAGAGELAFSHLTEDGHDMTVITGNTGADSFELIMQGHLDLTHNQFTF